MHSRILIIAAVIGITSFQAQAESSIVHISPNGAVHVRNDGTIVDIGSGVVNVDTSNTTVYTKKPAYPTRKNIHNPSYAGATYVNTDLSDKNFNGQNLAKATFTNVTLERVSFRDADLRGAKFVNVEFHNCDLRGARVDGATFSNVDFNETYLSGVDFSRATMVNVERVSAR